MEEQSNLLIVSSRSHKMSSSSYRYLFHFEDEISKNISTKIIEQGEVSTKIARHLSTFLQGTPASFSFLSDETLKDVQKATADSLGKLMKFFREPSNLKVPSFTRSEIEKKQYSVILLCLNQVGEIPAVLNTFDFENKIVILYIVDAWEPRLKKLSSLINQYNIEVVLCPYLKSAEFLQKRQSGVYWLPQGFNKEIWKDYGLDKKYEVIQFGRNHPGLHEFFLNRYKNKEYIHEYIEGDFNLAQKINESKFFAVSPQKLVNPNKTGDIEPVTMRYYQGIACKALPVGFKPKDEFDILFSEEVDMIEYKNKEQFREKLDYFSENKEEYERVVNKNYEHIHKNHTWKDRVERLKQILKEENILKKIL